MNKRLFLLSGVAILGVVFNHAAGWGQIALVLWRQRYCPETVSLIDQMGSWSYYLLLMIRQLTSPSVAIFLFVSGFFVAFATRGSQSTLSWKLVKTRIVNLLVPYLIWSAIIFAGDFVVNGIRHTPLEYLTIFATVGADGPYFFVPLLCYLYLLAPFLVPIAQSRGGVLLLVAALVQLSTVILRYLTIFNVNAPGLDQLMRLTPDWSPPRWIFFFVFGLVSGYQVEPLKQWLAKVKWGLLVAVIILGLLAIVEPEMGQRLYWANHNPPQFAMPFGWLFVPFPISNALYSVAVILCLLAFDLTPVLLFSKALYDLGSKSFGIYLIHHRAMEFIARIIYHFAAWTLAYQVLYLPILLLIGLGSPLLLMAVTVRSPARRYYRYLFG